LRIPEIGSDICLLNHKENEALVVLYVDDLLISAEDDRPSSKNSESDMSSRRSVRSIDSWALTSYATERQGPSSFGRKLIPNHASPQLY